MLDHLPLELVSDILRVTAEACLQTDHQTILNIALSCSLGYGSAIPALYTSIVVDEKNKDYVCRIFDENTPFISGLLHAAPSQRLCHYIRRIFLETNRSLLATEVRHLVNLHSVFSLTLEIDVLPSELYPHIAPTLRQLYVLSVVYPKTLPESVTHVSYYVHVWSPRSFGDFEDYVRRVIPDTATHIALELNESIEPSYETSLLSLFKTLLTRNSSAPIVLRLYRNASGETCERVVLRAIARLGQEQLRRRVKLWRDARPMVENEDDINTSKLDCIAGRTPWEEAESVSQAELEAAQNWQEPSKPVEENEPIE